MAILRSEIQPNLSSGSDTRSTYDCIAQTAADLNEANTAHMGVGSMAYVIATGSVYVKESSGWTALTA